METIETMKRYSMEYILSFRDKCRGMPDVDKKYIVKVSRKKNKKRVYKEMKHEIKNPWMSTTEKKKKYVNRNEYLKSVDELKEEKGKLVSLLNKLSNSNFDGLFEKISNLNVKNDEYLKELVNTLYKKCIGEREFIKLYVVLIKKLINKWKVEKKDGEKGITFLGIIIENCYKNYKGWSIDTTDVRKKSNVINNICLICELFNISILSYEIITECINEFLSSEDNKDFACECICTILTLVGDKYEVANYKDMNDCITKLKNMKDVKSKIKFMIMDLVDLYNNKWKSKEDKTEVIEVVVEKDDKLKKCVKNLILEYLDVLDPNEVKECYIEYNSPSKEDIFCDMFVNVYVEQNEEDRICLKELGNYMIDNNYIVENTINKYVDKIRVNIEEHKIDYPNIEKVINEIVF